MPAQRRPETLLSDLLTATGAEATKALPGRPYELRTYTGKLPGYKLELVATRSDDGIAYRACLHRADGTISFSRQASGLDENTYEVKTAELISELARLGMVDPDSEKLERLLEE